MEQEVENVEETEIEEEVVEEETTEDEEQETEVEESEEESDEEKEEEPELEDWMKSDDEEVKFPKSLKAKKKLKGELEKKELENEELKARIKALEEGKAQTVSELKRPKIEDFDTDEEYEDALDKYNLSLFDKKTQAEKAEKQQRAIKQQIEQSMDEHYTRAEKLIEASGIAPEKFKVADTRLREVVDSVFPGKGDDYTDYFLSSLGEGSERVGFYLGNNEAARDKFRSLLIDDPNGIKAAVYLGKELNRLNNPQKKKSNAKPPGPNIKGETGSVRSGTAYKNDYKKAHKSGDTSKAFNIRRQAKAAGIDVSKW